MNIDHEAVKKCAQECVELASGRVDEIRKSNMAGIVGLAVAYLDLDRKLALRDQEITDQANKTQSEIGMLQLREKQLEQQLAAELARVAALECALKEAIELSAACIIHSKSAEEVVATVNQLTAIMEGRDNG